MTGRRHQVAGLLTMLLGVTQPARAQSTGAPALTLDSFDTLDGWSAQPADGVALSLHEGTGRRGGSMRLDFDFHGHGGYAVARKAFRLTLPGNYAFSFWLRGAAPVNNLEFKLVDASGEDVWWRNQRDVHWPVAWQKVTIKRRQIDFAWGPHPNPVPTDIASIEIVVTAGAGGKGSIWLDDLALTPLEADRPYDGTPVVTASSARKGGPADAVLAAGGGGWGSKTAGTQWIALDFGKAREFGGLVLDWSARGFARDYDVQTSENGRTWTTLSRVRGGDGARDYIWLPDSDSRYLRLLLLRGAESGGYSLRHLDVKPLEWAPTKNAFFSIIAADAPRGDYPRPFLGEQSYWTIVGVSGGVDQGLLAEDGRLEIGRAGPSIEPFLFSG
ncbi:MAG: discoidin domain-containing protein, partial [Gemmatimonadota bacterium]